MTKLPLTPKTKNSKTAMRLLEFSQFITPDGEVFQLSTGNNRYTFGEQGFAIPAIDYFTQSGPFQHGETPRGYTYRPRILQMDILDSSDDMQEYWDARYELLDFLRQNRQEPDSFAPAIFRKVFMDGSKRDICVFLDRSPVLQLPDSDEWHNYNIQDELRFVAFDPFFFDPVQISENMVFSAVTGLVFPISAPIAFGGSGAETDTIDYDGTVFTNPTIVITGPARNPDIRNLTTDQIIRFSYNIAAGESVTITTGVGNFSIISSTGADLRGTMDIVTDPLFKLVPHPTAPSGVNSISISAGSTSVATQFLFNYFVRYIGL